MHNPLSRYYHKNGDIVNVDLIDSNACWIGVETFNGQPVKIQPGRNFRFFSTFYFNPNLPGSLHPVYSDMGVMGNHTTRIIPTQGRVIDIKGIRMGGGIMVAGNQMNINIDNNWLKQFPNLEWFGWYQYQYGRAERSKTQITGDWKDIPTSIKYLFFIGDCNNVKPQLGDMSTLTNLLYFHYDSVSATIGMNVNISGNVANTPRTMTYWDEHSDSGPAVGTVGTLTGKLSDFPPLLTNLHMITKPNNIVGYDTRTFPTTMRRYCVNGVTLTSAELDQFLIDISQVATWNTEKKVQLIGSSMGIRTSASDAAVATLQSKGVTIQITNNTF